MKDKRFDIVIVGSGFAGSLTAMVLHQLGYEVCIIEKNRHPRFAIGESSTPIADMILRDFADQYNLPFLKDLSRYGSWQNSYPELVCGLKRGFSYYFHQPGKPFSTDEHHTNELLVAASENDQNSDTNWLRRDVDHFLVKQSELLDIPVFQQTEITKAFRHSGRWELSTEGEQGPMNVQCRWLIDATGTAHFSKRFLGANESDHNFHTHSEAIYTHATGAGHWLDYMHEAGFKTDDYPYNPDHSALHHIIDEGWVWMLRFNTDLLSAGVLVDKSNPNNIKPKSNADWHHIIGNYPSLKKLFGNMQLTNEPGQWMHSGRLQRMLDRSFGNGWVCLNHTTGFVDPLHSTGIAFALKGVERISELFGADLPDDKMYKQLAVFDEHVKTELIFIDRLVSACYKTRSNPELFHAAVMLYFVASVQYEQKRLRGNKPHTFLCAGDRGIQSVVKNAFGQIQQWEANRLPEKATQIIKQIQTEIGPYNNVGLMDPAVKNMYRHTAVEIP